VLVAGDDEGPAVSALPFAAAPNVGYADFVPNSDIVEGVLAPKLGVVGPPPKNELLLAGAALNPVKTDCVFFKGGMLIFSYVSILII
jgi:hypothetical protein